VTISRSLRRKGKVTSVGKMGVSYNILVRNDGEMRPFARPGYRWELKLKEKNEMAGRSRVFSAVAMNLRFG
jgi:hypothetical protein